MGLIWPCFHGDHSIIQNLSRVALVCANVTISSSARKSNRIKEIKEIYGLAFEMWAYRRMLRVSWTEHKTDEEVLRMVNTASSLLPTIKKRKCQYFGHVRARSIQKLLLEDKIEGKRERERLRITWMKNIKEWLGHTHNGCVRRAEDPGDP